LHSFAEELTYTSGWFIITLDMKSALVPGRYEEGSVADETMRGSDRPTDEELAAAVAAVRILLRRRQTADTGSRWARTGRAERVMPAAGPLSWTTAERPR